MESEFKTLLHEWRKRMNWMQKEAADYLGVPLRTYQSWEWGRSPARICRQCVERKISEAVK